MSFPNSGELEALEASISRKGIILGLYRNLVVPTDGSLTIASLTEMTTGGGRGYAPIVLPRTLNFTALALNQWYLSLNSSGKAQAQFSNVAQQWTMTAVDVADGYTVQGVFGYTLKVPFSTGSKEIKVGDTIKGGTSAATGVVTGVVLTSGTWAAGTAAGFLFIENQTGTFQNAENLYVAGEIATFVAAPTVAGDVYSVGDTFKVTTGGEGGIGTVLTLVGGDNSGVATIGVNPGAGGRNYTVGAGKVTAKLNGGGNDALTVEIATLATAAYAVSATGTVNSGDSWQMLMFVNAMTTPTQVTQVGQPFTYTPILSSGNDTTVT